MEFLRRSLDDPGAAPCGRCDGCAGPRFTADVSPDALSAAQAFLGRAGVEIAPKKMWPTGLDFVRGKLSADEQALPGRAVGRLSDLGWGGRLRSLLAPDTPDVALPADVAGAVVEVLKSWAHGDDPWPARPVAVVAVASRRRPALVRSLAEHISTVGRLPLLGEVLPTAGAPPSGGGARGNSAQRVRALNGAFAVPADLAAAVAALDGPVLLVDDLVDSGWTMTMAARELRVAGAPAVLPLALAIAG
jgi:ATP-dependent DNA helicase RecQ